MKFDAGADGREGPRLRESLGHLKPGNCALWYTTGFDQLILRPTDQASRRSDLT